MGKKRRGGRTECGHGKGGGAREESFPLPSTSTFFLRSITVIDVQRGNISFSLFPFLMKTPGADPQTEGGEGRAKKGGGTEEGEKRVDDVDEGGGGPPLVPPGSRNFFLLFSGIK